MSLLPGFRTRWERTAERSGARMCSLVGPTVATFSNIFLTTKESNGGKGFQSKDYLFVSRSRSW